MGVEHQTVVTCERCGGERRYDVGRPCIPEWWSDYALAWPAEITPYNGYSQPHALHGAVVCLACLTDEEREQLTTARVALQQVESEIPF